MKIKWIIWLNLLPVLVWNFLVVTKVSAEVTPLGCYKVDKGNPTFLISAGDYDPESLTVRDCLVACAGLAFQFAALEGQSCLCSNDNYSPALKQPDDIDCAAVCTGDATQKCGNGDYSLVYNVADEPAAIQLSRNETAIYVVGTARSAPVTTEGTNLLFHFDYGDGGLEVGQDSYTYALPGAYVVSAVVENLKGVASDAVQVNVEMAIGRAGMVCPVAVELSEVFNCTLEVYEGSNIDTTFDLNGGARTWQTFIGTPTFSEVGTCAQANTAGSINAPNAYDAALAIPDSEFRNPGRVIAFETYITNVGTGQLDILILRPTCSGGNVWCPTSNTCESSCDWTSENGEPLSFSTCSASSLYCPYGSKCVTSADPYTCPTSPSRIPTMAVDSPRSDYTVVKVVTRTVTVGYNYLRLNDIVTDMLPEVQVGDVLGFKQTTTGPRVGIEGPFTDRIEFRYDLAATSEGSILAVADGQAKPKRHHIKAITSQPVTSTFEHSFTIFGDLRIEARLTNPITTTPVVPSTLIGVQSPVLDLFVEVTPTMIEIGSTVTLMALVSSGNPVRYIIDWDDGNIEYNISRQSEAFDEPDNITHTYSTQDGLLTINVTGSNLLSTEDRQVTVMVQRPIVRSQYVITSNSPQPHPCYPCQTAGIIQFTVTLHNPSNDPIGTFPTISLSSGTHGNSSEIPLPDLSIDGDSTTVDFMIRFPGDYEITYKISNLVSSEDYTFGMVSTQIPIEGFGMKAMYKPPLGGSDDLLSGSGALADSFAINLPVAFVFVAQNGTGITVTFTDFGDSTPAGETTKCETISGCRLEHKYDAVGTYTVTVTAGNSVNPPITSSVTIKIEENIGDITVKELNKAAAGEVKRFRVEIGSVGTDSCLMIDYDDGSGLEFYGEATTCATHASYLPALFVSAIPGATFTLTHTYDANGSYNLKQKGFNRVSSEEFNHPFAIIGIPCDVPHLEIEGHHNQLAYPMKYLKSEAIVMEVTAVLDCVVLNNDKRWKLDFINPDTKQITETHALDDVNSPYHLTEGARSTSIRIPPHALPFGVYKLTFTMTIDAASTGGVVLTNSISQYMEVEPAPLIVQLVAGQTTSTIVGFGETLDFNPAANSINPNLRKGEDPGFDTATFKYFCSRFYEDLPLDDNMQYDETPIDIPEPGANITEDRGGCFFTGAGRINHTEGSFTLSTKGMLVNMTHDMIVIVNKDGLEGRAKFKFTVKEGTYPQPVIGCGAGTQFETGYGGIVFNPTSDMRLEAACVKGCRGNLTREWGLYVDDGAHRYELRGWQTHATGLSTDRLFIGRDLFGMVPNATTYEFTVIMTNEIGYSGKGHVLMAPNKPPRGGSCNITSYSSSIMVGKKLEITCDDWVDENGIDAFKYYVERADYNIPIYLPVLSGAGDVVKIEPPAGTRAINYRMDLMVEISDKLGAKTVYKIDEIEILPNGTLDVSDPALVGEIQNEVILLLAEGNPREINNKLQGLASLLNDQRENEDADIKDLSSANDSTVAAEATLMSEGEAAYRGYLRLKIIEMCAELTFNTLQDLQLVATSLSVCTVKTDELSQGTQELLVAVFKRLLDKLEELGEFAPQDVLVGILNTVLDNLGNAMEGVHHSTVTPLTMLDKLEASGGDFNSLKSDIDAGRGSGGSITTTWPTTTAMIDEALRGPKAERANGIANSFEGLRKRAQGIILKNKLADEPQTVYKSNTITSRVARAKVSSVLQSVQYEDENGGPTFPSVGVLFEHANLREDDEIDAETTSLRKNPRNYDPSSSALADNTEVQEVSFKKADGSKVTIQDLKEPILIRIARPKGQIPEMRQFNPENNTDKITGLSCHSFDVTYDRMSITVDFIPYNKSLPYQLYVNYKVFPTLDVYDKVFSFYNESSEFYDNGTFNVFVSDDYITNNTGKYFVCIRELTVFEGFAFDLYNVSNNFSGPYFLRIVQTGCRYWNKAPSKWSSEGTMVDARSDHRWAYCLTTHLSSFASAWIVPPTPLDFNYIFANAGFAQNLTIYITTIVVYVIFIFIFIWARRKDKKDVVLLGVTPLPDNNPKDKYYYEIVCCTGQRRDAGTDSKVSFILSGDQDETDSRTLEDNMRPILKRSAQDRFLLATPRPLGTLNYMRLWHDNSGEGTAQSWYLQYIAIRDLQTRERFYFIVNNWFSLVEGDGEVDRLVPVAGKEQMQSFDHVFYGHTRKNLNDGHIWFSIFARPAGSRFTRLQRSASCMMLLWLEMLVNIMYYKVIPPTPASNALNIGPFSLSPAQVSIGVQSAIIVFPVSLLVVQLFRKARPKKKRVSRIANARKEQHEQIKLGKNRSNDYVKDDPLSASSIDLNDYSDYQSASDSPRSLRSESQLIPDYEGKPTGQPQVITTGEDKKQKKKKKSSSSWPWWTIIIAWIVVLLVTAAATVFTIFYGIQFGNKLTSEWLASFVVTTITGILFTQPIKVIAIAIFIALVLKTPNADEDDDMEEDEEDVELATDEEWLHGRSDAPIRRKIPYQAPDPERIERLREKRIKELEMYSIIREIILYIIFLWVLMMLSYGNQDPYAYIMKEQYTNTLVGGDGVYTFDKIVTIEQFWLWVHRGLVPNIYAGDWYNGVDSGQAAENFFSDRYSFIVGYPVMRQVRVRPDLCKTHDYFTKYVKECNDHYTISGEDEAPYNVGWIPSNASAGLPKEWTYTPWDVLDGYPFIGRHATYIGGGYAVELGDPNTLAAKMKQLDDNAWVDRYTRAVFVEFSTYNAQVNLFAVVTLVVEFLPTGGGFPNPRVDVLRLLTYYEGFALVQVCCEAIFLVFIVFFIVKEVKAVIKEKRKYWKEFWNIAEWLIIGFSVALVVMYFYRFYTTKSLLNDMKKTGGKGYVKLQYVAYWNELLGCMIGWVVFMATLKFVKLLRFNKRMSVLSSTIRVATNELVWFALFFAIIFGAFCILFYLILGGKVFNYSDFVYTMESLITAILGKFHFGELVEAERILGPIMFFIFMGSITFILINMLLTIINEAFQEVKHNIEKQSNDYEMVDFMISRFKAFLGMQQKVDTINPKDFEKEAAENAAKDIVDMFPDKVDQLLNHISKAYFNQEKFDDVIKSMGNGKLPAKPRKITPLAV